MWSHRGIPCSNENEQTTVKCNSMDRSHEHTVETKKPDTKE